MGDNEITLCYHGKQPPTGNFSSYGLGRLMGDGVLWRHNLKVAINQLASWDGPTIQFAFKAMNLIEDMYELITDIDEQLREIECEDSCPCFIKEGEE